METLKSFFAGWHLCPAGEPEILYRKTGEKIRKIFYK